MLAVDHPRFSRVDGAVFVRRVVVDCMDHRCAIAATGGEQLDACCQYGADVDLLERDAIAARADAIRPILRADARDVAWFDESEPEADRDAPSGTLVRTAVHRDRCV